MMARKAGAPTLNHAEWLVLAPGERSGNNWVIKGTETWHRYPDMRRPGYGVRTFGSQWIDCQLCLKIDHVDAERVATLGFTVVKLGTVYAYVAPPAK